MDARNYRILDAFKIKDTLQAMVKMRIGTKYYSNIANINYYILILSDVAVSNLFTYFTF